MTYEEKKKIDAMSYEQLLRLWRSAPSGEPLFKGDTGNYYFTVMSDKKKLIDHVAVSKRIG